MIAVRMRDERERFPIPRIEPDIFVRQINAAFVTNFNHAEKLRVRKRTIHLIDTVRLFPFA